VQTRQYLIPGILSAVLAFSPTSNAFEAFGFTSGMSQKAVEQASGSMNLGAYFAQRDRLFRSIVTAV
jgi:hypothetical protein